MFVTPIFWFFTAQGGSRYHDSCWGWYLEEIRIHFQLGYIGAGVNLYSFGRHAHLLEKSFPLLIRFDYNRMRRLSCTPGMKTICITWLYGIRMAYFRKGQIKVEDSKYCKIACKVSTGVWRCRLNWRCVKVNFPFQASQICLDERWRGSQRVENFEPVEIFEDHKPVWALLIGLAERKKERRNSIKSKLYANISILQV